VAGDASASEMLLLLTRATIAPCDDFDEIAAWGGHHLEFPRQFDLVIEAVFEDMAVKTAFMAEFARIAPKNGVIATNTSKERAGKAGGA
jgi:3-hydroxyacyl-CoA dehydrogenase